VAQLFIADRRRTVLIANLDFEETQFATAGMTSCRTIVIMPPVCPGSRTAMQEET
jgi:hypothetical protein